jgi:hypothetical protein
MVAMLQVFMQRVRPYLKSDFFKKTCQERYSFLNQSGMNCNLPFFFLDLLLSTGLDDKRSLLKIQNEYVQMIYTQIS